MVALDLKKKYNFVWRCDERFHRWPSYYFFELLYKSNLCWRKFGWVDGWMDGWTDVWMDWSTDQLINQLISTHVFASCPGPSMQSSWGQMDTGLEEGQRSLVKRRPEEHRLVQTQGQTQRGVDALWTHVHILWREDHTTATKPQMGNFMHPLQ